MKRISIALIALLGCSSHVLLAQSQYFGQNKPRYKKFDFEVLQSPHYELYHYFDDRAIADDILINSEHWYKLHQEVFKLAFIKPNPLIIYKNHPDFQETTAIGGTISEGTGGVTEGLRTRVVMPVMYTHRQTDHVLGHELVHAFQYQTMTYGSDSTSLANIQNLPLFMVEGLAEYMSIGREDSHTAMWMRDAVESGDIPTIEDLVTKQYKYFPYRWGQAFWSYTTATYGDDIIRPLFKETAIYGIEAAFKRIFKMDINLFSANFKKALIDYYKPFKEGKETEIRGAVIASKDDGGEMNLSPTISPDGQYIAYISSRNVLSIDIYIAEAATGKVIKRIPSSSFAGHVDSYSFIETAGTWSPDSKHLAIVVQSKGKNKLSIINTANGNKKIYSLKGVDSFTNPTWSPDGNSIVVSGLMEGHSDLYSFNIKTKDVKNLTNDEYSDIQPSWSPDGRFIYFVSDRGDEVTRLEKANLSISRLEVQTGKVESLDIFKGADNFNPVVDPSGNQLIFLSDRDGYRNMYEYDMLSGEVRQLTNYYTGVSGITMFSPAISMASKTGDVAYSYFLNGEYTVVKANDADFLHEPVENSVLKLAGVLPPPQILEGRNLVQTNLEKQGLVTRTRSSVFNEKPYHGKFKLDYLANSGLGVSTSRFGTGLGGGITGLFSDMLNNNQLGGTLALNGEIQDFGGQFYYLNQTRPLQFGASLSHIPYQFFGGTEFDILDTLNYAGGVGQYDALIKQRINRLFIDEASVFAFRPFSKSKRLEAGTSMSFYNFSVREYPEYARITMDDFGYLYDYFSFGQDRPQRLDPSDFGLEPFRLNHVYGAFVGDNATFGTVAPLNGYRYRFQVGQYFGTTSYTDVLLDARKYQFVKPFTIAGRVLYNGRLNPENLDFLNQINPLYLGFPWYMHGFYGQAFNKQQANGDITQQALMGEQLAVANFEVRLPFTGPEQIALIPFQYLPSDLNFYVDAGMVWSRERQIGETYGLTSFGNTLIDFTVDPIITTGLSLRINVLGYLILEPYFAVPFYNGGKKPVVTGMNFMIPGW
ncbi:tolB protein precursor [Jiulongibacter sp. NS-SX5]|uniref:tolB protein precursor n=1 Tax=Jiulongibacter sp. NS-SX5 TaxID=3463854 RepID=UPI004059E73C